MDRRTLLALGLTAIVIVATPMLFPAPRQQRAATATDTAQVTARDTGIALPPQVGAQPARSVPVPTQQPGTATQARGETTLVRTDHSVHAIVSPGGTPAVVTLPEYRSLRPGATRNTPASLLEPGDRLLRLRLASGRDTIVLDSVAFRAEPERRDGNSIVRSFASVSSAIPVTLTYRFPADSFVTYIDGTVGRAAAPGAPWELLVTLPSRIRAEEADILDDTRHLSIGYKTRTEIRSVSFRDLDSLVARVDTGAIRWIAERNKYFVIAVIPGGRDSAFRAVVIRGGPRSGGEATAAHATAILPLSANTLSLRVFAGPQSWQHLRVTAPDLENVNPYGGWMHGLVQPFATIVMRMLDRKSVV